jgi:hypothetical protein
MGNVQNLFKFKNPTLFPNLNASLGKSSNHLTAELSLTSIKYKHLREMAKLRPEEQMEYMMMVLTGLSSSDIGEMSPSDAAELIKIIYESMSTFNDLAKNFMNNDFSKQALQAMSSELSNIS